MKIGDAHCGGHSRLAGVICRVRFWIGRTGLLIGVTLLLKQEYRQLYECFLPDSQLVKAGVLRRAPIDELLREHLSGAPITATAVALINAELWYRMMITGGAANSCAPSWTRRMSAVAA